MHIALQTPDEILQQLANRLREQRLAQEITQQELADRAGLSLGAVRKLEGDGHSSLPTLVKVVQVLGLVDELAPLFALKGKTIAQMEQMQATKKRQRAPLKPRKGQHNA